MMRRHLRPVSLLTLLVIAVVPMTTRAALHECANCHTFHGAVGPTLLNDTDIEVMCLTCHGDGGTASRAEVHEDGSTFTRTCIDCHTPHSSKTNWRGGTNIKQIGRNTDDTGIAKIDDPSLGLLQVVFEQRGVDDAGELSLYSFADGDEDGDGDYDGICEVCHTSTSYHKNDGSGNSHNDGDTCTRCHDHANNFKAAGGSCIDCHSVPKDNSDGAPSWQSGRRAIMGEFAYASNSHHADSVTDADCTVCHNQDQHMQGVVRLNNVDTSAVIALDGDVDPATNLAEAQKLETFCLACHDSDGATTINNGAPTTPFNDGVTRPTVDAVAWNRPASHKSTLTCYGDGTSMGCHSSGHGSEKIKLLAPYSVAPAQPTPNNVEEEEGFCFNCHDGGTASTDVKAYFDTTPNWVDLVAGKQSNLHLNDRHDVVYSNTAITSGAKIECADCHDPHTAWDDGDPKSLSQLRADPDPTDGHVPGTDRYLGTGNYDEVMTEWCLDCHDNSFPSGVLPHASYGMTNIRDTYDAASTGDANDTHGDNDGNTGTLNTDLSDPWPEDIITPCRSCHSPHSLTLGLRSKQNLFQLRDRPLGPTGTELEHWHPGKGKDPATPQGWGYELTQNGATTPSTSGHEWCNTCHVGSMGDNKTNCYQSGCHAHGSGKF